MAPKTYLKCPHTQPHSLQNLILPQQHRPPTPCKTFQTHSPSGLWALCICCSFCGTLSPDVHETHSLCPVGLWSDGILSESSSLTGLYWVAALPATSVLFSTLCFLTFFKAFITFWHIIYSPVSCVFPPVPGKTQKKRDENNFYALGSIASSQNGARHTDTW